jgi:hypothetical protein
LFRFHLDGTTGLLFRLLDGVSTSSAPPTPTSISPTTISSVDSILVTVFVALDLLPFAALLLDAADADLDDAAFFFEATVGGAFPVKKTAP